MSEEMLQKIDQIHDAVRKNQDVLVSHDKKFDHVQKTLDSHDKKFDQIQETLGDHDKQLDSIAHAVIENKHDIEWIKEQMATKEDHRQVMDTLDVLVKLAKKKDEELTFMGVRVKRIEDEVKQLRPANGVV